MSGLTTICPLCIYVLGKKEKKKKEESARACHASYMVSWGTKKNQAKKMNTRASMRAEALDVKAQEELVPEVQLTVVCWS